MKMNIVYLKELQKNPSLEINESGHFSVNQGISEVQIVQLEQLYNDGNPFPVVLKELLFLAGENCHVFDYNIHDTQQEVQEWVREDLQETSRVIDRPFYAFDLYNDFMFIYLDEGDNPNIYEAHPFRTGNDWVRKTGNTIKSLSEKRILRIKEGLNPF